MSAESSSPRVDAQDRFLDLCLHEELGRRGPPDLVDVVLAADVAARSDAALRVQQATLARRARPRTGIAMLVAVAAAAAAVAFFSWRARSAEEGPLPAATELARSASNSIPAVEGDAYRLLLDEFHAVMPVDPGRLRRANERERFAVEALHVLRRMRQYLSASDDDALRASLPEFEVYSAVLGDAPLVQDLAGRAARGESHAGYMLDVVALTVADDRAARASALDAFAARLATGVPIDVSIARSLVVAQILEEECARLLTVVADALGVDAARAQLRRVLLAAQRDPQRWVGESIVLEGRTTDGTHLSTADLRGDVVVVMFWASWCSPCDRMLEALAALRRRDDLASFRAIGVSCDRVEDALLASLQQHPDRDWPQLFDPALPGWHELAWEFGVNIIPTAFVLDRGGVVLDVVHTARDLETALLAALPR